MQTLLARQGRELTAETVEDDLMGDFEEIIISCCARQNVAQTSKAQSGVSLASLTA